MDEWVTDDAQIWIGIVALILFGFCVCWLIFVPDYHTDVKALGSSICSEEYDLAFESFSKGILHCKSSKVISYDGINVSIDNG